MSDHPATANDCRLHLPAPLSYAGADRCPACRGVQITGARHELQPNPDGTTPVLLVVVFGDGCRRRRHPIRPAPT